MKKKILLGLICGILVLGITTGCGNSKNNDVVDTNNPTENKEQVKDDTNNNTNSSLLSGTYKVPLKNIVVDVPNYQEIEQAFTELFIVHDLKYVAFTSAKMSNANNTKEAHKVAFEELISNMQNYEGGINSINITKSEEIKVNGIDVYSFEGTINYGTDTKFDGYAKGYSFILDGVPCEIIGSVIDKKQDPSTIKEISSVVDAMIKTLRTEE